MSKIEVNTVDVQCGSTLTLGSSGKTVQLATGASQSGFGRTGTVNWVTTKKTANFTAVSGEGYFCDTSSAAFTLTLPASPSAGDIVGLKDYAGTFATNNLTIGRNGSPINGGSGLDPTIKADGASLFLVYVDGTQGWLATQDDASTLSGESFIVATGGTITTCGNDKIHTFTGPGTFTVCSVSSSSSQNIVSYMVVAGGGGSATLIEAVAGGGAGGFRELKNPATSYTASPLDGYPTPGNRITVTAQGYPITVGGGGAGGNNPGAPSVPATTDNGSNGSNSVFSTITSTGGGGSGGFKLAGNPGGSGGGGGGRTGTAGGAGNTPPVTPPQGNSGGASNPPNNGPEDSSGGGGGATAAGTNGSTPTGGAGGAGATTGISGSNTAYAGGGGGGGQNVPGGAGGTGGGGAGGSGPSVSQGTAGTVNTGGGAGGKINPPGTNGDAGLAGGSGIVIIRYKFQ
jgi:hypothetical protein